MAQPAKIEGIEFKAISKKTRRMRVFDEQPFIVKESMLRQVTYEAGSALGYMVQLIK